MSKSVISVSPRYVREVEHGLTEITDSQSRNDSPPSMNPLVFEKIPSTALLSGQFRLLLSTARQNSSASFRGARTYRCEFCRIA